ncbi:MAG: hypothetical protein HWE26_17020 [Alteromonadaceae bacterium]|nr:hypothetical protein [Alteromonadaceae bacterium]
MSDAEVPGPAALQNMSEEKWLRLKAAQGHPISPERLTLLAGCRRGSVPTPLSFAQQMEEACKRTSARVRQVLAARGNTPTSGDAA